jgi:hypothetical protein
MVFLFRLVGVVFVLSVVAVSRLAGVGFVREFFFKGVFM